jgi:hypothetical protein
VGSRVIEVLQPHFCHVEEILLASEVECCGLGCFMIHDHSIFRDI